MSQKIVIASVAPTVSKDGSKTFYTITDSAGARMTTFDSAVLGLSPGDTIEADIEVKGKFTNLVSYKLMPKATPAQPAPPPAKTSLEVMPSRERSIETQVAAKIVADLIVAGQVDDKNPLYHGLVYWLKMRLPSLGISVGSGGQGKAGSALKPAKTSDPQTPEEFVAWCKRHTITGKMVNDVCGIDWKTACQNISTTVNTLREKLKIAD